MKDFKKKFLSFFNRYTILLLTVFFLGLFLRFLYIYPDKIIFGYDQVMDVMGARKIVTNHDLIIHETNPNALGLNHGVLVYYFTAIPYLLGGGSPMIIAFTYAFFNALTIFSVFAFTYYVFKKKSMALISSFIAAVSYQMVLMAGWISNTVVALYLMPLFFLGLWLYRKRHNWGLVLSAFLLGILIQSQMLMIYNLVVVSVIWLIYKLRWPGLKIAFLSTFVFLGALSTMILVELRTNYSTLKVFFNPSGYLDESSLPILERFLIFFRQFSINFSLNLFPQFLKAGTLIASVILLIIIGHLVLRKIKKEEKNELLLLLIFLVSPIFMLVIGYHNTQWSLIGMIPAISVAAGYIIFKIPSRLLKISVLSLIFLANINMIIGGYKKGELFINQEPSSTLKGQLAVIDYTYQEAYGETFAINAVSYPLYNNTYWSYHYPWYDVKKYGYLPTWLGGDQLYPYNTLPKTTGKENIFYMIIDETGAIPEVHKAVGRKWGFKYGKLLKEKLIGGFTVQKFQRFK